MVLDDQQKIGVLLTGFGMFFTFLGVLMFFDRGLLAIGNLLFLTGVTVGLGLKKDREIFLSKKKITGHHLFHTWNLSCYCWMGLHRVGSRDIWVY